MPYTPKQLRWAHTKTGIGKLGSSTVKKWDKQVKTSGYETPAKRLVRARHGKRA